MGVSHSLGRPNFGFEVVLMNEDPAELLPVASGVPVRARVHADAYLCWRSVEHLKQWMLESFWEDLSALGVYNVDLPHEFEMVVSTRASARAELVNVTNYSFPDVFVQNYDVARPTGALCLEVFLIRPGQTSRLVVVAPRRALRSIRKLCVLD